MGGRRLFVCAIVCASLGCGNSGSTSGPDAQDSTGGLDAQDSTGGLDARLRDRSAIYVGTGLGAVRVSGQDHAVTPFGSVGRTTAIVPSPSGARVAQELGTEGRVDVYTRDEVRVGSFDIRPGLLGWRDDDTLVFFDRTGTQTLHIARFDGSGRHDLPDPDPGPRAIAEAALDIDGARAAVMMNDFLPSPRAVFVVSTMDGAVVATLDSLGFRDLVWEDDRVAWLESWGKVLASTGPDLPGTTHRLDLGAAARTLDRWAGDAVLVGTYGAAGDAGFFSSYDLIHLDSGERTPLAWLGNAVSGRVISAAAPDGSQVAVATHDGLVLVNPDGSGREQLDIGGITAIGW